MRVQFHHQRRQIALFRIRCFHPFLRHHAPNHLSLAVRDRHLQHIAQNVHLSRSGSYFGHIASPPVRLQHVGQKRLFSADERHHVLERGQRVFLHDVDQNIVFVIGGCVESEVRLRRRRIFMPQYLGHSVFDLQLVEHEVDEVVVLVQRKQVIKQSEVEVHVVLVALLYTLHPEQVLNHRDLAVSHCVFHRFLIRVVGRKQVIHEHRL
mmetsp:Transcript_63177/g.100442  ORF Transcript_63177/g.100442 Transcript_63177/m.100442 type:complete len:208 (-) Transcript_63177:157-780(-)